MFPKYHKFPIPSVITIIINISEYGIQFSIYISYSRQCKIPFQKPTRKMTKGVDARWLCQIIIYNHSAKFYTFNILRS